MPLHLLLLLLLLLRCPFATCGDSAGSQRRKGAAGWWPARRRPRRGGRAACAAARAARRHGPSHDSRVLCMCSAVPLDGDVHRSYDVQYYFERLAPLRLLRAPAQAAPAACLLYGSTDGFEIFMKPVNTSLAIS